MTVDLKIIDTDVKIALAEDIGSGDVTAKLLSEKAIVKAKLITREPMILAGRDWFERSFILVDDSISIEWFFKDGQLVESNETIAVVYGPARSVLTAERTAINFMQTLSGTATKTRQFVDEISGEAMLLDTRKTVPKLRYALKYAVNCGGGHNHRMGLYDAYLIKENHIKACGSIDKAVSKAREMDKALNIEVEVETIDELQQALSAGADTIMLDNFSIKMINQAVKISNQYPTKIEVSGGITLDNISDYDIEGVDYLSVGDLTKSVQAIDLSLQVSETHKDE